MNELWCARSINLVAQQVHERVQSVLLDVAIETLAALKPTVRLVGAEPAGAAKLTAALAAGAPVALEHTESIADGLLARAIGDFTFAILHRVVRGAVRAKKPVVVYMDSLAASGGYYVSCGGKYLMANETTITGSIGVIIQTLNYEQLFNKIGLSSVVFKSGKFKDLLNGGRPLMPEEREFVQSFVMKTYDKFLGIVAKERSLPADGLRNSIADGRILSGKDALENKLIDSVGQIEDRMMLRMGECDE